MNYKQLRNLEKIYFKHFTKYDFEEHSKIFDQCNQLINEQKEFQAMELYSKYLSINPLAFDTMHNILNILLTLANRYSSNTKVAATILREAISFANFCCYYFPYYSVLFLTNSKCYLFFSNYQIGEQKLFFYRKCLDLYDEANDILNHYSTEYEKVLFNQIDNIQLKTSINEIKKLNIPLIDEIYQNEISMTSIDDCNDAGLFNFSIRELYLSSLFYEKANNSDNFHQARKLFELTQQNNEKIKKKYPDYLDRNFNQLKDILPRIINGIILFKTMIDPRL